MLSVAVEAPLSIDSSSPAVIEKALRLYPGRALVNSISAEAVKIEKLLPVASKYGAALVALPLDDDGVPKTAPERRDRVERIFAHAEAQGYRKADIVVDGLVMTVSSDNGAASETLNTVAWAAHDFGVNTTLGLSNISFGLPARKQLNAGFLLMAAARGLTMVIADMGQDALADAVRSADLLSGHDADCLRYIARFATDTAGKEKDAKETADPCRRAFNAVVNGDKDGIEKVVREALATGVSPFDLVDGHLIPGIVEVGDRYERGEYFLPQLMLSAETMEKAFGLVEPLLDKGAARKAGKVVIATVKGDIHDIGKNIVALMLRNYGFDVIDLGKDVAAEDIVRRAREEGAHIIGLSALMTTTMTEMAEVIERAKSSKLEVRFMVGGAVVTEGYATQIGADAYARDAVEAVKTAQRLMTEPCSPSSPNAST
jgi:5-methyltetrahydrofolate--homocysteine methyltransferase